VNRLEIWRSAMFLWSNLWLGYEESPDEAEFEQHNRMH